MPDECGDVRPLDEARMRKVTINGVHLVDRIDSNAVFLAELAAAGCITWRQREHLINLVHSYELNDKLLEFLTRRSVADFQKFMNVLAKEQAFLVPLLVTDGGEPFQMWLSFTTTALLANDPTDSACVRC